MASYPPYVHHPGLRARLPYIYQFHHDVPESRNVLYIMVHFSMQSPGFRVLDPDFVPGYIDTVAMFAPESACHLVMHLGDMLLHSFPHLFQVLEPLFTADIHPRDLRARDFSHVGRVPAKDNPEW